MYSKHLPKRFINEIRAYIHTHKYDYDHDQLREDYGCIFTGLHQELFNKDYYIIGCFNAKEWLGRCSWDAVRMIQQYERDQFGETYTTEEFAEEIQNNPAFLLERAERIVNKVAYILGEEAIWREFRTLYSRGNRHWSQPTSLGEEEVAPCV